MSDDLEEITVAAGKTVSNGRGWPPRMHGPGTVLRVSAADAEQLRKSGHAIDPNAQLVKKQGLVSRDGAQTASIGVGAADPLVNPGTIGGPQ